MRIGADSGGTFTDVVGTDGRLLKLPSTARDPGRAVRDGVRAIARAGDAADPDHGDGPELLSHGTTVATNALLERRGARVALLATEGFADVVELARGDRPSLYDPWADRPAPLVAPGDRLEVVERLDAAGRTLVPYRPGSAPAVPDGVEAVAVCLLHADLGPDHERAVAGDLRAAGWDVSASHEVSPEPREYERTVTTVVNAFLRPVCRPYLRGLADAAVEVTVMTSGGGLVDLETAGELPVALLLSGPAAGVRAAAAVAVACGHPDALTFDMGGTSTDVCLVLGGEPELASGHRVAGLPVRTPAVDVHTIGAGGGSIAGLDPGGALVVGPRSAGAVPGPACYGRGGSEPTVTDADLVAGRIPDGATLGELGTLDRAASERALAAGGVDAEGVIAVVDANMEQALRAVSVERGVDPAGLALVAFGGAGPLHACALADALGMPTVIVPAAAGVLSAVGLLTSPRRREVVRSRVEPADHAGLADEAAELSSAALAALGAVGDPAAAVEVAYDCRYAGQSHELRVPTVDAFPAEHVRRNGVDRPGDPIEVTAVRAVGTLPPPATIEEVLGAWEGRWTDPVVGPVAVAREDCTIWVADGWVGEPGPLGSLVLHRSGGPGPGRRPPDLTAPGFAALSGGRNGPPSGDRPPPPGDRTSGRVAERRGPEESLR